MYNLFVINLNGVISLFWLKENIPWLLKMKRKYLFYLYVYKTEGLTMYIINNMKSKDFLES